MPVAEVSSDVAVAPMSPAFVAEGSNPINIAFDDLLGLSVPSDIKPLAANTGGSDIFGMSAMAQSHKESRGKRPWMRATIKATHAEGSPVVDWSKVSLYYRVHTKQDGTAMMTCRVENQMDTTMLHNLTLKLKGLGDVAIGNVDPVQSMESSKAGPFAYEQSETSVDLKGSLVTPECKVSVKLSLPATQFLAPLSGLSQDDIMSELSSSQWSSHSVKLTMSEDPSKAKSLLCSFLHAFEVEEGSSPTLGTLAAQSQAGSKVFVLVKVQGSTAKLDLKCSNATLGKALAADLKRLVL